MNVPYLWGGRSAFGIDCSGLTQLIYRICGVTLPRDSYQQASCGKKVDLLEEALDGDLAFFEKEGRITHVGMVLSGDEEGVSGKQIVHASDHYSSNYLIASFAFSSSISIFIIRYFYLI